MSRLRTAAERPTSASLALILAFALVPAPFLRSARGQCSPVELARVLAADAAPGDGFGYSVAISGDTAIVGAYLDDEPNLLDAGAAYVFVRSGGVWAPQAKLVAADALPDHQLGYSVAIDGDTAVVGAWHAYATAGFDAGAAYVYVRTGTVWTPQAKLTASDAAAFDHFGAAVAISGDTILVAAPDDYNEGGDGAGAVYVFTRSGTVWTELTKLRASDAEDFEGFGWSVALEGGTALIGAALDDIAFTNVGSAYVFVRSAGVWSEQAKLAAADGLAFDELGWSVALSGDTALIGAPFDNRIGGTDDGSAYVFVRSGTVWTPQGKLNGPAPQNFDYFAWAVALAGDTALIGAWRDDHAAGADAGSAYVFTRSGTVWTYRNQLIPAATSDPNDRFGVSVALAGDRALIGAHLDDHAAGSDAGGAYFYDLGCGPACGGDADGDDDVDQDDLDLVLFNFGTLQPAGANGDVDGDGDVDQDDLDLVLFNFGTLC